MKRHSAVPILLLLFGLAINTTAFSQSLPASMAYSSSVLVSGAPTETSQNLLIAGNSLTHDQRSAFDLSVIPAVPDSVARDSKVSSSSMIADEKTGVANAGSNTGTSKFYRSMALLGVLAIAYLATRRRPNPRMKADISDLRNFPKKRLAHHGAHA